MEIKSGLKEGDKVLINASVTPAQAKGVEKPDVAEFETKWAPRSDQAAGESQGAEEELEKPPADMEERAKAFLQNLTPEQKKQMEERLKGMGMTEPIDWENMSPEKMREIGRGMRERAGRDGQGPRTPGLGPPRRGPRPERRPGGPSPGTPGTGARPGR